MRGDSYSRKAYPLSWLFIIRVRGAPAGSGPLCTLRSGRRAGNGLGRAGSSAG